jgi:superfamily I DNA/RNA helicase
MERFLINKTADLSMNKGRPPPTAMSSEAKAKLVGAIRRDFESMLSVSPIAAHAEGSLLRMTQSQAEVFWGLAEYNSRVLIFGPAGTGKTLIAHRHFNSLLSDDSNLRASFICFNGILADYLRSLNPQHINAPRSFVGTVYQLLREACPSLSNDKSDLSSCEAEARAWAVANPNKLYDVLIIDEGQDLRPIPAICAALGHLIKGGWDNGRWAWFEDLGQSIIRGSSEHFQPPAACRFPLLHNVRNTEHIAETANTLSSNPSKNSGVYGLEVDYRLHQKTDPVSRYQDLEAAVVNLLKNGFSADQIVILDYSGNNEVLEKKGKIGTMYAAPWSIGGRNDTVRFSTCRKFKGMESRAVVVYNINGPISGDEALLYVAVTRPVFSLTLIMEQSAQESMAKAMLSRQTR